MAREEVPSGNLRDYRLVRGPNPRQRPPAIKLPQPPPSLLKYHQIMLITDGGTLVRTPVKDVSIVGRNTQGVKLINLTKKEKLVGLERVLEVEDEDDLEPSDSETAPETADE